VAVGGELWRKIAFDARVELHAFRLFPTGIMRAVTQMREELIEMPGAQFVGTVGVSGQSSAGVAGFMAGSTVGGFQTATTDDAGINASTASRSDH
jgi:hypothetical protein